MALYYAAPSVLALQKLYTEIQYTRMQLDYYPDIKKNDLQSIGVISKICFEK